MQPVTEKALRSAFINASRSEAAKATLPDDFADIAWEDLDYFGWRDARMPQRGYILRWQENRLVGLMLRAPDGGSGKNRRVLCDLCRDVFSKDDVYLWVARRAGQSGRDGNTVGTLVCADFGCSRRVRVLPKPSEIQPDPHVVVAAQIDGLARRTDLFLAKVGA